MKDGRGGEEGYEKGNSYGALSLLSAAYEEFDIKEVGPNPALLLHGFVSLASSHSLSESVSSSLR